MQDKNPLDLEPWSPDRQRPLHHIALADKMDGFLHRNTWANFEFWHVPL